MSQECEDLRKENKHLSNEIHMERITMRTENELIMRNLRNLNQELQAQIKEVPARGPLLISGPSADKNERSDRLRTNENKA